MGNYLRQIQSVFTITTANEQGGGASSGWSKCNSKKHALEGAKGLKTKRIYDDASNPTERVPKYIPSADANELPIKGMQKSPQRAHSAG